MGTSIASRRTAARLPWSELRVGAWRTAVVVLVLLSALAVAGAGPEAHGGTSSGRSAGAAVDRTLDIAPSIRTFAGPVALGSGIVHFGVQALYVSAVFAPSISVSNGTVGFGNRSDATVRFTGSNATFALTVPGISETNLSAPALGTQSILIPGINDTVGGVPLSIYLDLVGQVNATTFVGTNGSGGGVPTTWSASGSLSVPFGATGHPHSEIEVGVANLSYVLSIGVVAKGTVEGYPVSVNLLTPAPLPSAPGAPSTVVGVFEILAPPPPPAGVPPPSTPAPASHAAALPSWELALLIAGTVLAVAAIGLALWRRSAARGPVPPPCPSCGHSIPHDASFCPGCARPLQGAPPSPPSPGESAR